MPTEESLDLLAKRVINSGQTYSVFDLAKVLLQSRDRFRATFEAKEQKLFRCREDQSIWLTRVEALRHLWRGDWLKKYYDEVKVEGEVPKGSFSAVARCGLSNQLLGPPNYHGYQEKLAALHRERFSNMPLDAYKAKVRMEHGEEAVEAWLESMKTVTKWKVAAPQPDQPEEKTENQANPSASPGEASPGQETGKSDPASAEAEEDETAPDAAADATAESPPETPLEEDAKAPDAEKDSPEAAEAEAGPAEEEQEAGDASADDSTELFEDARAVERHFAENHFDEVFEETDHAWVKGDIRGDHLSPGLLTLLKRTVAEEKRYPAKLMPIVCRQLSGRHVAVFKWNKKLKVGPSRPHAVPSDSSLAERPQAIITHLSEHSGEPLKDFWKAVMPTEVTAEQKHEWLQDFQWLLGEGHIILLADTTVHLAKKGDKQAKRPKPAGEKEFKQTKALVEDPKPPAAPGETVLAAEQPAPTANDEPGAKTETATGDKATGAGEATATNESAVAKEESAQAQEESAPAPEEPAPASEQPPESQSEAREEK